MPLAAQGGDGLVATVVSVWWLQVRAPHQVTTALREQPRREQRWGAAVRMRSRTDPAVPGSPVLRIEKAFL